MSKQAEKSAAGGKSFRMNRIDGQNLGVFQYGRSGQRGFGNSHGSSLVDSEPMGFPMNAGRWRKGDQDGMKTANRISRVQLLTEDEG